MTKKERIWHTLYEPKFGRPITITIWKNKDFEASGQEITLGSSFLRSWSAVMSYLTLTLKPRFGAVRKLFDLDTKAAITCLKDIKQGGRYVAVGMEKFKYKDKGYVRKRCKRRPKSLPPRSESVKDFMEYTKTKKRKVLYFVVSGRSCQKPLKVVFIDRDLDDYHMILQYLTHRLDAEEGILYVHKPDGTLISDPMRLKHGGLYVAVPFGGEFVKMDYRKLFDEFMLPKTLEHKGEKKVKKLSVTRSPVNIGGIYADEVRVDNQGDDAKDTFSLDSLEDASSSNEKSESSAWDENERESDADDAAQTMEEEMAFLIEDAYMKELDKRSFYLSKSSTKSIVKGGSSMLPKSPSKEVREPSEEEIIERIQEPINIPGLEDVGEDQKLKEEIFRTARRPYRVADSSQKQQKQLPGSPKNQSLASLPQKLSQIKKVSFSQGLDAAWQMHRMYVAPPSSRNEPKRSLMNDAQLAEAEGNVFREAKKSWHLDNGVTDRPVQTADMCSETSERENTETDDKSVQVSETEAPEALVVETGPVQVSPNSSKVDGSPSESAMINEENSILIPSKKSSVPISRSYDKYFKSPYRLRAEASETWNEEKCGHVPDSGGAPPKRADDAEAEEVNATEAAEAEESRHEINLEDSPSVPAPEDSIAPGEAEKASSDGDEAENDGRKSLNIYVSIRGSGAILRYPEDNKPRSRKSGKIQINVDIS